MCRILFVLWTVVAIEFGWIGAAFAEDIQTFEGVGEYRMDMVETPNVARAEAKKRAERDALEQIYIFVSSESRLADFDLDEDEVISITAGVLMIKDTTYKYSFEDENVLIESRVVADVDVDRVIELVERAVEDRGLRRSD